MTSKPPGVEGPNGDSNDGEGTVRVDTEDADGTVRVDTEDADGTVRVEPDEPERIRRDDDRSPYPSQPPTTDEFGWEGWLVVGVLIVSFLVVPPAIVLLPEARGVVASLGLTMRDAYLALPMVPAILLGATAVWAALRHRRR